jgi:hypothetical protein
MRTYAKTLSRPEPASPRGAKGRHAKPSGPPVQDFDHGRPLPASTGHADVIPEALPAPTGPLPAEETGAPDWREPGLAPAASPLPRRVAGQSGRVAPTADDALRPKTGDPLRPLGVIPSLTVSGAPPWEPAPKPPGVSQADAGSWGGS